MGRKHGPRYVPRRRASGPAACWASPVKSSQVSQERLFAVGLDVVLRVVATLLWTPVDLFESAQQAAVEDLAFQDLPERARESTCSSSDAHSEGQNRVGSVRVPLGGGRGWYGLAADEWRRALEVPRSGSVTAGPSRMEPSMVFISLSSCFGRIINCSTNILIPCWLRSFVFYR